MGFKSVFKAREKNGVVTSMESGREIEECQKGDFARGRSKQQLVIYVD